MTFTAKDIEEMRSLESEEFSRRSFTAFDSEGFLYRIDKLDSDQVKLTFAAGEFRKTHTISFEVLKRDFSKTRELAAVAGEKRERKDERKDERSERSERKRSKED